MEKRSQVDGVRIYVYIEGCACIVIASGGVLFLYTIDIGHGYVHQDVYILYILWIPHVLSITITIPRDSKIFQRPLPFSCDLSAVKPVNHACFRYHE